MSETGPMTLLVDPPWSYNSKKTGAKMASGASQHYGVMSLDQIAQMDIKALTHGEPTVLFLWATVPLGDLPFQVLKAWGFKYHTTIHWHKTGRLGMGHWMRGQIEPLLVATRGTVKPFKSSRRNVIDHPTLGHSVKPDVFHALVEELVPNARVRVELFARRQRQGWQTYGMELGQDFLDPVVWQTLVDSTAVVDA